MFFIDESYENYLNLTKKVIEKESFSLQVSSPASSIFSLA